MNISATNDLAETANPASGSREFCSTSQAAAIIGVSHRTIQLWVESGILHAWKTAGGHRRITIASVNKLVDQRHQALSPATAPALVAARKQLLVVDDDATLLRLYELEMGGWDLPFGLLKAQNGFEALIRIGEVKPDLLITDLSMPGMDGFRMIRTLRAASAYADMAIIVVSGLDKGTVASMGLPADIPFFPKPVPFRDLRDAVQRVLLPADTLAAEH
jgi:excisionase family DNA binding protein